MAAGAVDAWSDLDAMVAVPDGGTDEFWPDLDWLPDLGEIVARSSGFPRRTAVGTGLLFGNGRKIDVTGVESVMGMISAALDCFEQILSHSETQPDFPRPVLDRLIRAATP